MTPEELKAIKKQASRAKRIATEKAGELHDLVEDSLPAGYEALPAIAEECYAACQAWEKANDEYLAAEKAAAGQVATNEGGDNGKN